MAYPTLNPAKPCTFDAVRDTITFIPFLTKPSIER